MKCLLLLTLVTLIGGISSQLVGGKTDIDTSTAEVQSAAKFAFDMISKSINSVYLHLMGKVTKAQSQVVAGVKYFLTIEVNETSCRLNTDDTSNCTVTKTEVCEAVVWSRPWLETGSTELLEFHCQAVTN